MLAFILSHHIWKRVRLSMSSINPTSSHTHTRDFQQNYRGHDVTMGIGRTVDCWADSIEIFHAGGATGVMAARPSTEVADAFLACGEPPSYSSLVIPCPNAFVSFAACNDDVLPLLESRGEACRTSLNRRGFARFLDLRFAGPEQLSM